MQQVDYSNVQLSLYETIVLKLIRIFRSEIWYKRETINILRQYGFIKPYKYNSMKKELYKRTHSGSTYLRIKGKSFRRFLIPTIISILALFGGYDVYTNPLLKKLLEAIMSLFENIVESLEIFR